VIVFSIFSIVYRSYIKLYDACRAVEALLFPLKYTGVYVPVLPCFGSFLEFPAAPTPYIIGVHAAYRQLIEEMHSDCLQECVKVDLDGASVSVPQCVDDLIYDGANTLTGGSSHSMSAHTMTRSSSGTSGISVESSIYPKRNRNKHQRDRSLSSNESLHHHQQQNNLHRRNHFQNYSKSGKSTTTTTFGLPNHLYESTMDLLFSILKPDVLHADEMLELCKIRTVHSSMEAQRQLNNQMPSPYAMNETSQPRFVSQLTTETAAAVINSPTLEQTSPPQLLQPPTAPTTTNNINTPSLLLTTNVNQMSQSEIDAVWIDKLLRAVFVRLFAQLFAGYRYCLLIVRINPKPVIYFNKANFLAHHGLVNNEFMNRLLDSMSFQRFIEERGPSYRHCDVFDDLYADIQSQLSSELDQFNNTSSSFNSNSVNSGSSNNTELTMQHLKQIAEKLYKYEYPQTSVLTKSTVNIKQTNNNNTYHQQQQYHKSKNVDTPVNGSLLTTPNRSYSKIKMPTPDAFRRIHSEVFPLLNSAEIERQINFNSRNKQCQSSSSNNSSNHDQQQQPRNHLSRPHLVPYGPPIETVRCLSTINKRLISMDGHKAISAHLRQNQKNHQFNTFTDNFDDYETGNKITDSNDFNTNRVCATRKAEAISQCIAHIFSNNFKEAKKLLNSVYRALRDPRARLHLCSSLEKYVKRNQVILNNEQFEYVCKLLNEALSNDSSGLDEYGVAYACLPLASAFYRKLNNGTVDQCIYTRIQQHSVWDSMQFWEMAFFTDVQRSIRPVYLTNEEFAAEKEKDQSTNVVNSVQEDCNVDNNNFDSITVNIMNSLDRSRKKAKNGISIDLVDDTIDQNKRPDNLNLFPIAAHDPSTPTALKNDLKPDGFDLNFHSRPSEKTALEICGEQMEKCPNLTEEQREAFITMEQGIIRSHVLHYITLMVNMKIPLDVNSEQTTKTNIPSNTHNNVNINSATTNTITTPAPTPLDIALPDADSVSLTTSMIERKSRNGNTAIIGDNISIESLSTPRSRSFDEDFNDHNGDDSNVDWRQKETVNSNYNYREESMPPAFSAGEPGYPIWNFVSKFVDRVCMEGSLSDSQKESLHYNLAEVISMQIQTLETVYLASKRVPARCKPKFEILKPDFMFPGEHFIEPTPLRCHLMPDGREEVCGVNTGGSVLLPAEGCLFLTNYRLIYRGIPIGDALMNDAVITRSFPVSALMKEKKISNQYQSSAAAAVAALAAANNSNSVTQSTITDLATLHDGLQMRSASFQLIKVFFDEEVTTDRIELFRHALLKLRYPQTVLEFFCFSILDNNQQAQGGDTLNNMILNDSNTFSNGTHNINNVNNCNGNTMSTSNLNDKDCINDGSSHNGNGFFPHTINIKTKEKHTDALRHFAKNTLRKAGLMPRNPNRKIPQKQQQQQQQKSQYSSMASRTPETARKSSRNTNNNDDNDNDNSDDEENLSIIDENNLDNLNSSINTNNNGPQSATMTPSALMHEASAKYLQNCFQTSLFYSDFIRQGLIDLNQSKIYSNYQSFDYNETKSSPTPTTNPLFRICTLNINYQLCKSYPALFIVPKDINDECIKRNAKCHRQNRFPLIVWQHGANKSILLRSSGFHGKGFIGMLIKGQSTSNTSNENNASVEQDRYITEIIKLTKPLNVIRHNVSNSTYESATLNPKFNRNESSSVVPSTFAATPLINRRSLFASKLERAVQTIKSNINQQNGSTSSSSGSHHINGTNTSNSSSQPSASSANHSKFNTIASVTSSNCASNQFRHFKNCQNDFDTNSSSQVDIMNDSFNNSINSASSAQPGSATVNSTTTTGRISQKNNMNGGGARGTPLYIVCEKSQVKSLRSDASKNTMTHESVNNDPNNGSTNNSLRYSFIPIDIHEVRDTKASYKKLCRACIPSAASTELINEIKQYQSSGIGTANITTNSSSKISLMRKNNAKKRFSNTLNSKKRANRNLKNTGGVADHFNMGKKT
jgi:hypothetical protein